MSATGGCRWLRPVALRPALAGPQDRGPDVLKRYALYALFIAVFVSVALALLSRERPKDGRPSAFRGQPAKPQKPWTPSAELDAEANADFRVEAQRANNIRLAGKSSGADWPQFAGAHRDNMSPETGLLPRWPSGGPSLGWISRGLGAGFSTVSVVNGVVYTMGNKGESEAMIALDVGTGEKIWSTPIGWASHAGGGDGPRSTPTVSGGAVYGLGANGDLACVDAGSGKVRWRKDILQEFKGQNLAYGICESVLIDENRLICTPGGDAATLVALEPQTGNVIWKSVVPEKDRAGYASPIVTEVGGVRQYVQLTAAGIVGVRADNGDFLWRDNTAANSLANCSSPLAAGNLVFQRVGLRRGGRTRQTCRKPFRRSRPSWSIARPKCSAITGTW